MAPYSHVFLWDGDVKVPPSFRPLEYLRLAVRHRLVISTPGHMGEQTCDAATGLSAQVQETAYVEHEYSVWRADWWAQVTARACTYPGL